MMLLKTPLQIRDMQVENQFGVCSCGLSCFSCSNDILQKLSVTPYIDSKLKDGSQISIELSKGAMYTLFKSVARRYKFMDEILLILLSLCGTLTKAFFFLFNVTSKHRLVLM